MFLRLGSHITSDAFDRVSYVDLSLVFPIIPTIQHLKSTRRDFWSASHHNRKANTNLPNSRARTFYPPTKKIAYSFRDLYMANPALSMRPYGTSGLTRGANTTTQQHREAQRLERERAERVERERMERAGQSQLGELSEEQREEINEAVCLFCNAYEKKRALETRNALCTKRLLLTQRMTVSAL